MIVLSEHDGRLVTRLIQRLMSTGIEVPRLRALLLMALVDAAQLAGDKDEARALSGQLAELARASTYAWLESSGARKEP